MARRKTGRQIINPYVGFGQRSIGPYANRIGQSAYARNISLGERPADFQAFGSSGGAIKALVKGQGSVTFARSTEATVRDFEGLYRTVPINCLRPERGRILENLATGLVTETITVINGAEYQLTINGDSGATAVCSGAFTGTLTANGTNRISWPNGTPKTSGSTSLTITVTGTLTQMLLEDVTAQANQNPSENVDAGAEHGLVANGVKAFAYQHNNTVDGFGVVTEAKGADITDWRFLFEPASTNYSDTDDDLSGGAETVDLTAAGTGDYTLSVAGTAAVTVAAGTATGTGFGQATEGNPVTFNLTGAGTVTLTLDSGTLDTDQGGNYIKQVEKLQVASSFIPAPGGNVTRTADDASPMFDYANWSNPEGTWACDFWLPGPVPANMGLFNTRSSSSGVITHNSLPALQSFDSAVFVTRSYTLVADEQFKAVIDFGNDRDLGVKNVTQSGSYLWANGSYDGSFPGTEGLCIGFGVNTPLRVRTFIGYTTRKGRDWVVDNL